MCIKSLKRERIVREGEARSQGIPVALADVRWSDTGSGGYLNDMQERVRVRCTVKEVVSRKGSEGSCVKSLTENSLSRGRVSVVPLIIPVRQKVTGSFITTGKGGCVNLQQNSDNEHGNVAWK